MNTKRLVILLGCGCALLVFWATVETRPLWTAKGRFCDLSNLPWPEEGRMVKEEHYSAGTAFSRNFLVEAPTHQIRDWVKRVETSHGIKWKRSELTLLSPLLPINMIDDEHVWCTYNLDNRYHVMVVVDDEAGRLYLEWWGQ